jgi:hypothetical protein
MALRDMGGVVVETDAGLFFVPASVALKFVAMPPKVLTVPDAPPGLLGVALIDGTVIPVVAVGPARDTMLVCTHLGEPIGLVGHTVVASGTFEPAQDLPGSVRCKAGIAKTMDLSSLAASLSKNAWAGRSTGL